MTGRRGKTRTGQKPDPQSRKRRMTREVEMSSILTNNGAMVALQTMKSINAGLARVQSEISTGKAVGSAKDSATVVTTLAFEE